MEESKGILSKKWFFWTLFVFLFGYAIVRAWTVVPMLDELASFYSYIRTGHYFNTIELVDANNHVLNSFFGHQFYRLFGDHFFLFRIASLCAFPVYFFSLKYIVQSSLPKKAALLVFVSIVCIPWVFEYFSYSRGYGMAIAFFFAAIALLIKWKSSGNLIYFALILACLWLSVASSLTYLFPSILLFLYVIVIAAINGNFKKGVILPSVSILLVWMAGIVPFIRYSFELKDAGALWWGNQDGLWESTGKSLSRLVLFTDDSWVMYALISLLIFGLISFFISWTKNGFWSYLKHTEAIVFILLIGCITGIVVMRFLFDVNYPMDRVGMYLVPLFILFLGLFLSKYRFSNIGLFALIFLPISFIFHFNISTSIFSPEDRIPTYLSDEIKSQLDDNMGLSAEYVSHMSYAYSCRNDAKVHIAFTAEKEAIYWGDYHINWLGRFSRKGYDIYRQDPDSRTRVLKQKAAPNRKLIADTLIQNLDLSDMYFTIFDHKIDSSFSEKLIQVEISGKMDFDFPTSAFNIVQTIDAENGNESRSENPNFGWYFSDRTDVNFVFVDRPIQLKSSDKSFNFFLFNHDLRKIAIEFVRVRVYEIDQ